MDFLKANSNRYSVRSFSDKDVDDKILTNIVKQAQQAPSWANAQPWKVCIAKVDTLDRIKRVYHDAPAVAFLTIEEFNPWSFMT